MYSPGAFVETDLAALDWLLLRDPFVTLVSCDDAMPFATHLPVPVSYTPLDVYKLQPHDRQ